MSSRRTGSGDHRSGFLSPVQAIPKADSTPCEDGDVCTSETGTPQTPDHCFGGVCTGIPVDCSGEDDQCNVGVCNPATGACEADPVADSTPCEDGDICTSETGIPGTPDHCESGTCVGVPVDCDDGDVCTADSCDPDSGACISSPSCLDIKPSSCPNPVNPNSNGIVPVALIGSANFDVTQVDISTIELSRADGVGSSVTPHEGPPGPHTVISDVAPPFPGELCDCHKLSGDGIDDVSFKFKAAELAAAFLLNGESPGTVLELVLTGNLFDGTPIDARDCMVRIPVGFSNMNVSSNMQDTFMLLAPLDLNVDGDGFVGFGRAYLQDTVVTITAPPTSLGRTFVRWSISGILQPSGLRTIEVMIKSDVDLEAIYRRSSRIAPELLTEDGGDMD